MLKLHKPSDIRQELVKIGADPDFMRFILVWNELIFPSVKVDFITAKRPEAYQRKIKRRVEKDFGKKEGKKYWKEVIMRGWKERNKIILQKGPFKIEPLPPNPSNRPRKTYSLWSAVNDFRNYMNKLTTKPQMALIQEFLISAGLWGSGSLYKQWDKRKNWFKGNDYRIPIDDLLKYDEFNKDKEWMSKTLKTGIPIYETLTSPQTKIDGPPKFQLHKTETIQIGNDDDHWFNVRAKKNLTIDGNRLKKGEQFVVLPRAFDEKTMVKIGTIPRCEPFTKFIDKG